MELVKGDLIPSLMKEIENVLISKEKVPVQPCTSP